MKTTEFGFAIQCFLLVKRVIIYRTYSIIIVTREGKKKNPKEKVSCKWSFTDTVVE